MPEGAGRRTSLCACAVLLLASTPAGAEADRWDLPPWQEPPPEDNPMSAAKVDLGWRLFYEIRLSGIGYMCCATCHDPARAFSDVRVTAPTRV